jgi:hypothetical protein
MVVNKYLFPFFVFANGAMKLNFQEPPALTQRIGRMEWLGGGQFLFEKLTLVAGLQYMFHYVPGIENIVSNVQCG